MVSKLENFYNLSSKLKKKEEKGTCMQKILHQKEEHTNHWQIQEVINCIFVSLFPEEVKKKLSWLCLGYI